MRVVVELRTVNNRHLKLTVRGTEPYPHCEADFEKLLRKTLQRGSVSLQVQVWRERTDSTVSLNVVLLRSYIEQTLQACSHFPDGIAQATLAGVLALPGVALGHATVDAPTDDEWELVQRTLELALAKCLNARRSDGAAMAAELRLLHDRLAVDIEAIRELCPRVVVAYRKRLLDRIRAAIADAGAEVQPEQLVREVALYADRTDVAEELTRFTALLAQFRDIITGNHADGAGRRLEFVVQELGREVNTLGSKAGDVAMTLHVFDLKSNLEKIRELIQNIE